MRTFLFLKSFPLFSLLLYCIHSDSFLLLGHHHSMKRSRSSSSSSLYLKTQFNNGEDKPRKKNAWYQPQRQLVLQRMMMIGEKENEATTKINGSYKEDDGNNINHQKSNIKNNDESTTSRECFFNTFEQALSAQSIPTSSIQSILQQISNVGFQSSQELIYFAYDFQDKPQVLSNLLQSDFGFNVLDSHRTRAALLYLVRQSQQQSQQQQQQQQQQEGQEKKIQEDEQTNFSTKGGRNVNDKNENIASDNNNNNNNTVASFITNNSNKNKENVKTTTITTNNNNKRKTYRSVIVSPKAKQRRDNFSSSSSSTKTNNRQQQHKKKEQYEYSLPTNYQTLYPKLYAELEEFYNFMTQPQACSQEPPIKETTANVYFKHAKLFLGWFVNNNHHSDKKGTSTMDDDDDPSTISIYTIFPTKERQSSSIILNFILWLRSTRSISTSYEANILRGLTKLAKYRFNDESNADPSYGDTQSFDDIPLIREMRKMQCDANKKQSKSARCSDEEQKWLEWKDYLNVVECLKVDVLDLMERYNVERFSPEFDSNNEKEEEEEEVKNGDLETNEKKEKSGMPITNHAIQRKIAVAYQKYLLLAFFSCIPDRQRTFRELDLQKTFFKDTASNCYIIKHGPDDYKTGKTYGDRPPLILSPDLTSSIDEFISYYRPLLKPSTSALFVQPRTGKPHTQNSIYHIVVSCCYDKSGKRTNPHLLRDMIVTHVRSGESSSDDDKVDASEKELEALALYMGHSLGMQRNSYDRRTMKQKVAPAVELLQNVNSSKKRGGGR